jgi:3-oxoacyl-(acyl-carrier-protein) synthase
MIEILSAEAISANGNNKEDIFNACAREISAVGPDGLALISDLQWVELKKNTPKEFTDSKSSVLNYNCLQSCIAASGWSKEELLETGFIFASTTSKIDLWEDKLPFYNEELNQSINHSVIEAQSIGLPLVQMKDYFQIFGPSATVTSSCSASSQAIALAYFWLSQGRVKRCIVGSTEILSDLTKVGFGSLRLLSKSICKPFDKNRKGINLGEGSAFLCLQVADPIKNETDDKTKNDILGYILGAGLSTDAHHLTAPHPEGEGSHRAIQWALSAADGGGGASPHWFYSHGTGSIANDLSEAKAIHAMGLSEKELSDVLVTSTKPIHGHTLGASGILETVLGLMALKNKTILPTLNFQDEDPEIHLKIVGSLNLKSSLEQNSENSEVFLKNSLGFGGINAALVLASPRILKGTSQNLEKKIEIKEISKKIQKELLASSIFFVSDVDSGLVDPIFRKATTNMSLAYGACKNVLNQARQQLCHSIESEQLGLILSTQFGEVSSSLEFLRTYKQTQIPRPILFQNSLHNSTLGFVAIHLKIKGPAITLSSDRCSEESVRHTSEALLSQTKYLITCFVDHVPEELRECYLKVFPHSHEYMNKAFAQLWMRR